jgi:hypothetical protein
MIKGNFLTDLGERACSENDFASQPPNWINLGSSVKAGNTIEMPDPLNNQLCGPVQ